MAGLAAAHRNGQHEACPRCDGPFDVWYDGDAICIVCGYVKYAVEPDTIDPLDYTDIYDDNMTVRRRRGRPRGYTPR